MHVTCQWQLEGQGKLGLLVASHVWGETRFRPGVIAGKSQPSYISLQPSLSLFQYLHHGQPIHRPWKTTSTPLQMSLSPLRKGFQSSRTSGTLYLPSYSSQLSYHSRRGTYVLIQAKNPSSALIHLVRNAFLAQTSSLVTLAYTTMIILTSSILQYLLKNPLK